MGLNSVWLVPWWEDDIWTETYAEGKSRDNTRRRRQGERPVAHPSVMILGRKLICQLFDLGLFVSRAVMKWISVVLSTKTLSEQP